MGEDFSTEHRDSEQTQPPVTVGELRRRLAELGNPWQVDPTLSDDEPLPDPPRGGAEPEPDSPAALAAKVPPGELRDVLADRPPANPYLRQRWAEEGLLAPAEVSPGAIRDDELGDQS